MIKIENREELIEKIVKTFSSKKADDYSLVVEWKEYVERLSEKEILEITRSLGESGKVIKWDFDTYDIASTGGIGNVIPLTVSALLASYGVPVPKISSRSLKHCGGTIDILESVGYKIEPDIQKFKKEVEKYGYSITAPTQDLAPWEKVIYEFRKYTKTVENIPLITSSILSKKLAVGAKIVGIDVKVGKGGMFEDYIRSKVLAQSLVRTGRKLGMNIIAFLTDLNHLQVKYIGNRLALWEVLNILKGKGPKRATQISLIIAAEMLRMAGKVKSAQEGIEQLQKHMENEKALHTFTSLLIRHGVKEQFLDNWNLLKKAKHIIYITSPYDGWLIHINLRKLNELGKFLIFENKKIKYYNVGFEFLKNIGDKINKGEEIVKIYTEDKDKGERVKKALLKEVLQIGNKEEVIKYPHLYGYITPDEEKEFCERDISLAVGIIKINEKRKTKFLLRYNKHWDLYNFVAGKFEKDKDKNLKDTILREIEEELKIVRNKDFIVLELLPEPLSNYQFSLRHKKWTKYRKIGVYLIVFLKWNKIKPKVLGDKWNKIFSYSEILENSKVSEMVKFVDKHIPGGLISLPHSVP